MQHRGVKIVDMKWVFGGRETQRVGCAVSDPRLNSAACQPHRAALGVMISSRALRHRSAAEFPAPDDERILEHTPLTQVADQRGTATIDLEGPRANSRRHIRVMIPARVIELHKPDATLSHPTGHQAVRRKASIGLLYSV